VAASSPGASSVPFHRPVLYQEVLAALQPRAGGSYIDGTVGAGGHATGLLTGAAPDGRLLGIDRDPAALELARTTLAEFGDQAVLVQASFADMQRVVAALGWPKADGILLDLGLSSMQLDDAARGFAFRQEGPLDMRFDPGQSLSANELVNLWPESELEQTLHTLGEEPGARRVAHAIVAARPILSTTQLAEVVSRSLGRAGGRVHPATRTFQALRMAVNDELGQLERGLGQAVASLAPGGRLAVIAFHSLEDRMVKRFFKTESSDCVCPPDQLMCTCGHQASLRMVTRKVIRPSEDEVSANPRARSARMRVAQRLGAA
jgi:16S rRNA (cytosine1402-N4)-methyltransferase